MRILMLLTSFALTLSVFGQDVQRETIEIDGQKTGISGQVGDMYDGTDNPEAQSYYGEAYEYTMEGDLKSAVKSYKKAIKADPSFVEAYDNLGRVYRALGDLEEAKNYYRKSIELYPEGSMAHQNLALVHLLEGNVDEAIAEYEVLQTMYPESAEGFYGVARIYLDQGDLDKALQNVSKAVEIYETENSAYLGDGYYLSSLIYYNMDSTERAQEYMMLAQDSGLEIEPALEKKIFAEVDPDKPTYTDEQKQEALKLETEEDYRILEEEIIYWSNWYLTTPMASASDEEIGMATAFILAWTQGSPYVTIEIGHTISPFFKCEECLIAFMGAWTAYTLETGETDTYELNKAAVIATMDFYLMNKKEVGKAKQVDKAIEEVKAKGIDAWLRKMLE